MSRYVQVATVGDIDAGQHIAVCAAGVQLLLARHNDNYYAVRNECTHQKSELSGGIQKGCYLFCPLHGLRFDLRDGSSKGKLANGTLPTYPVRVSGDSIEVQVA